MKLGDYIKKEKIKSSLEWLAWFCQFHLTPIRLFWCSGKDSHNQSTSEESLK